MTSPFEMRMRLLSLSLESAGIELAVLSDPDSIAYYGGYWNYLGMEFGRPTLMIVRPDLAPVILTPLMESDMCAAMSWVGDIRPWTDGGREWRDVLIGLITNPTTAAPVGVETARLPNVVAAEIREQLPGRILTDIAPLITEQRMIKSPDEIAIMRQAGEVAGAMMDAAADAIGPGVPEYEIALAAMQAGSRRAASLLSDPRDRYVSPLIHNLQILQSGTDTCMVHRRAGVRRLESGDPVYLCFCGMVSFRNYKLGFDRQFYVGTVTDEQARIQEAALAAQRAALATIRPGVRCEAVNAAAEEAYAAAGFSPSYRTGRSVGMSLLEAPELKRGETRELQAGMTLAIDGGITVPGKGGGRIGDSIVVTEDGFDYLTPYPRDLKLI
ncbi:M24 family metallopeptidase [Ancylobacter mangrovi]|uniref:M24 family metallopeptidase n=1 Tax=Ancylobacter mangrovi TaxID=2972472 RepID=UPI00216317FB|nr:Xaa-Pro peptidase family protein [Ancylobacter mangrovi]MCS0504778.1 Xaa-Pro peptidase family protein [Ancylobacter mangrovi]